MPTFFKTIKKIIKQKNKTEKIIIKKGVIKIPKKIKNPLDYHSKVSEEMQKNPRKNKEILNSKLDTNNEKHKNQSKVKNPLDYHSKISEEMLR